MYYQVKKLEAKLRGFTSDNTRAASFLNGFKNIRSKACPFGIKTIALLCKEGISIQEKQVDFKNSMVILKSMLFFLRSSFFVVEGRNTLGARGYYYFFASEASEQRGEATSARREAPQRSD